MVSHPICYSVNKATPGKPSIFQSYAGNFHDITVGGAHLVKILPATDATFKLIIPETYNMMRSP